MDNKNFKKPYTDYSNRKPINEQPMKNDEIISEVTEENVETIPEVSSIERVDDVAQIVDKRTVIPALLNVRVAPNASANILRTIPAGTEVNVLEYVDGFAKIADGEYVNESFLK